jgi:HD-GYP domain-containing protein (c-di-GMP phosphodiesterase class II)
MTTDRSYRKGRSAAAAMEEIRACSGTQFNPAVVEILWTVIERTLGDTPPPARSDPSSEDASPAATSATPAGLGR